MMSNQQYPRGFYDANHEEIFIFPDTILLDYIYGIAKTNQTPIIAQSNTESPSYVLNEIKTGAAKTLINEIEHSCQKSAELKQLIERQAPEPLINLFLEVHAINKSLEPKLQAIAQESISLNFLISNQEFLKLFQGFKDIE